MSERPRTSLGAIFLVLFLDLVGFSIVFPLYPALLDHYAASGWLHELMGWIAQRWPDMTHWQRAALFGGVLSAIYSGLQFLVAPWWGNLSDRIGRRPVLLMSITGNTFAYALWMFSNSFTLFLISRMLAGLMTGNVSTANAAIADVTTKENRAKGMALVGMAFGLGFILGPAIGGLSYAYLPHLDDVPWLKELGAHPFSMPAFIALALGLINLVWAYTRLHETLSPDQRNKTSTRRTINPAKLFSKSHGAVLATVNWATYFHAMIFSGLETTMVFLTTQCLDFGPKENGLLFAMMGFESALVQGGIFRRLVPRYGQRRMAIFGLCCLMPGFMVVGFLPWIPHVWLIVTGVSILCLGTGLVFPSLNTMTSLAAGPEEQGWALGGFRSANALGRAMGPLLAACAYFWISPSAPFTIGAIAFIIPLVLVIRLRVG